MGRGRPRGLGSLTTPPCSSASSREQMSSCARHSAASLASKAPPAERRRSAPPRPAKAPPPPVRGSGSRARVRESSKNLSANDLMAAGDARATPHSSPATMRTRRASTRARASKRKNPRMARLPRASPRAKVAERPVRWPRGARARCRRASSCGCTAVDLSNSRLTTSFWRMACGTQQGVDRTCLALCDLGPQKLRPGGEGERGGRYTRGSCACSGSAAPRRPGA